MNIAKLVRRNLSKPYAQRISSNEIRERVESGIARIRGNLLALQAQIHREIQPELDRLHAVQDWCREA